MKFIVVILAIIILVPTMAWALEVDFPGFTDPVTKEVIKPTDIFGPAQWINYIFVFALGVVGLGLIYAFTRAGIEWMLAGENSSKVSAARERIKKAIIGLLILLGSYIVLNTINPDLVNFRDPDVSFYITGDPYAGFRSSGTTCRVSSACTEKLGGQCKGSDGKELGVLIGGSSDTSGLCYYSNTTSFPPKSREIGESCDKDGDCKSDHCRAPSSRAVLVKLLCSSI